LNLDSVTSASSFREFRVLSSVSSSGNSIQE
jgi:hypothetical protein